MPDEKDLLDAQLDVFLDPEDPEVREQARRDGIPDDWIEAARRSPVYAMCKRWRIALPLHPEYRTLPMVWYVPPLSPVMSLVERPRDGELDPDDVFAGDRRAADPDRVPGELPVRRRRGAGAPRRCARLAAMRALHARAPTSTASADAAIAAAVGMEPARDRGDVPACSRSASTTTAT